MNNNTIMFKNVKNELPPKESKSYLCKTSYGYQVLEYTEVECDEGCIWCFYDRDGDEPIVDEVKYWADPDDIPVED